nr:M48 family metalloprotease [Candidatus Neomarinimicrobiota bacterium]
VILPIFILSFSFLNTLFISPIVNFISRYFENQADNYSFEHSQNTRLFITAMAGLANRNLSNAYPSRLIKIFYYSHPPVGERLNNAENFIADDTLEKKNKDFMQRSQN